MVSDFASGTEQDYTERIASDCSAKTNDVTIQVEATAVKNRSVVGKYFRKVASRDGAKVQCKICKKTVKMTGGNTTNLLSYLKTTHSNKYFEVKHNAEEEKKKKKQTVQRSSKTSKQNPSQATLTDIVTSKTKLRKITQKVAGMMIHDFQPFSFVEDRSFKELMEQLEPRYEIPHRTTFSRSVIPGTYEETK